MTSPLLFSLKIQKVDQTCLFELSWGQGQRLLANLDYLPTLTALYQEWQRVYFCFYKRMQIPASDGTDANSASTSSTRGRLMKSVGIDPPNMDWHAKLVEAEAKLLNEFHRWLRNAELFELRSTIAAASRTAIEANQRSLKIFLTCTPIELARLPWEVWEIGADFAATGRIQIVRTPANIRSETASHRSPHQNRRARILAILGDETGLNFQVDREAVRSLSRLAEVQFVGWQPGHAAATVKEQVRSAIVAEAGWDVLFFAGHSNETQITGGELAIAPGASIQISEIAPQLTIAKERGLQFALFNSCSGLSIAEFLINLGFSQVAIMREPIQNRVAQEFLVQFLQGLAEYKDVHESLLEACQFLRLEKNLTYPSAYLVPSLFCHPGAALFRITPSGWKQQIRQMLPTRWEALTLTTCLALSLVPQVQDALLDKRVWVQAVYRDLTGQVPPVEAFPPVALVQIDEASIERDPRIADPNPINQSYLADLIDRLAQHNTKLVGIDYLLNRPDPRSEQNTQRLKQALQSAVQQNETWFVFGTLYNSFEAEKVFTTEVAGIAKPDWSSQGYVDSFMNRVALPYPTEDCRQTCPFSYLLTLIAIAEQDNLVNIPQPQLNSQKDLRTQLFHAIDQLQSSPHKLTTVQRSHLHPFTDWSYQTLGLPWLQPIIDFSIPPDRIYDRIAAWRLFQRSIELPNLPNQVVLIASGGYPEAGGIVEDHADSYPLPTAVHYWRSRLPRQNNAATFPIGGSTNSPDYLPILVGGEVHAYTVHHLITQRLVVSVPDLWMVGIAALLGKSVAAQLKRQQQQQTWTRKRKIQFTIGFASAAAAYGLASLQLYISAAVLLPWLLPSIAFWVYILPILRRKSNA